MKKNRGRTVVVIGSLLVAAAALAVALYFWRQAVGLKNEIDEPANKVAGQSVKKIQEGDRLPEFKALTTDGREVVVANTGIKHLLFIFSPTCDRCESGMPSWAKVTTKLKEFQAAVQVIGLSIADSYATVEYTRREKPPFASVSFPSVELQAKYGATEVPLTVVVNSQSVVEAVWDKPLDDSEVWDVIETACPECIDRASVEGPNSQARETQTRRRK